MSDEDDEQPTPRDDKKLTPRDQKQLTVKKLLDKSVQTDKMDGTREQYQYHTMYKMLIRDDEVQHYSDDGT